MTVTIPMLTRCSLDILGECSYRFPENQVTWYINEGLMTRPFGYVKGVWQP